MTATILYSEMVHLFEENLDTNRWHLSIELSDWFIENNIKVTEGEFEMEEGANQFGLVFESKEDFMAFKLRWT